MRCKARLGELRCRKEGESEREGEREREREREREGERAPEYSLHYPYHYLNDPLPPATASRPTTKLPLRSELQPTTQLEDR